MAQILSDLLQQGRTKAGSTGKLSGVELEKYERTKAAYNDEAKSSKWHDPEWHREQAALLASELDYGFTFTSLFTTYLPLRTVGEFEKVYLRERIGMKVFYTHRGGYIEESQITSEDWELPRDTMGWHVSEFDDKLRANFAESMEAMQALGQARLEAEVNRRWFQLLQEAVPSSSPYYVDASATGLTAAVLNDSITEVEDAIKPNGLGPVPVTVIGRAAGINQISDFPGYAFEALEEIRLRGRLGTYRAANLVKVINYTDENGDSYIPDDEVWVFGGTVGLVALYGSVQTKTWEENTADYRHYRARRDLGGLIHHPEQARRIKIA